MLTHTPELERCSCTSLKGSLRSLRIENCEKLEVFDLFENVGKFKVEHRSWLSGVRELILVECPLLKVVNPLPPSATFSELQIRGVSTLPIMNGSYEKLDIWAPDFNSELIKAAEVLAFHNLRSLKFLSINVQVLEFHNRMPISFKDLSHLVSLKSLRIKECDIVFSSCVMPEHTRDDVLAANCKVFPSLQSLTVQSCGISGKGLSLMLQHSPFLEKLVLSDSSDITLLSIEEEENSLSNLTSDREPQDELFLHIPFNLISSLKDLTIDECRRLRFNGSKKGFSGFTSLEKLHIGGCPELLSSLVRKDGSDDQANGRWLLPESLGELDIWDYPKETLQPCFPSNLTGLKKLVLRHSSLGSLQLHSCTALEVLEIDRCGSLTIAEGLLSLGSLRDLKVLNCPFFHSYLESFSRQCCELLPRLETLVTDDPDVLTTSSCKHLTSLHSLELRFGWMEVTRLTEEQVRAALVLLKSLRELTFLGCRRLPAGLHALQSLKRLKIEYCSDISSLPETGLPVSLEELEITNCKLLSVVEGLQSLGSLQDLTVLNCPYLPSYLESFSRKFNELLPRLETLVIDDLDVLTTSFCKHLTSLHSLQLRFGLMGVTTLTRLTEEQERALVLLKSLRELTFNGWRRLIHLPAGLHTLPSLKRLKIEYCPVISRLPETGLPVSLEELEIMWCSKELCDRCMPLATSKLMVFL